MALAHAHSGEVVRLRSQSATEPPQTAALIKTDRFEAVRLVIRKDAEIPSHKVEGYVTLYCVEGRVRLDPFAIELVAGDWVYLDRAEPHSLSGLEDSILLLTIYFD